MHSTHVRARFTRNLYIMNTSLSEHFLDSPVGVHYGEVSLYLHCRYDMFRDIFCLFAELFRSFSTAVEVSDDHYSVFLIINCLDTALDGVVCNMQSLRITRRNAQDTVRFLRALGKRFCLLLLTAAAERWQDRGKAGGFYAGRRTEEAGYGRKSEQSEAVSFVLSKKSEDRKRESRRAYYCRGNAACYCNIHRSKHR
jgi:hypothetical protein